MSSGTFVCRIRDLRRHLSASLQPRPTETESMFSPVGDFKALLLRVRRSKNTLQDYV